VISKKVSSRYSGCFLFWHNSKTYCCCVSQNAQNSKVDKEEVAGKIVVLGREAAVEIVPIETRAK
jgi:hypothetical protein